MTARIVCHSEDCPALCQRFLLTASRMVEKLCEHDDHACPPCSGAGMVAVEREHLRKLVDRAERIVLSLDPLEPPSRGNMVALDAALQPFRAEPEEAEKYPLSRGD